MLTHAMGFSAMHGRPDISTLRTTWNISNPIPSPREKGSVSDSVDSDVQMVDSVNQDGECMLVDGGSVFPAPGKIVSFLMEGKHLLSGSALPCQSKRQLLEVYDLHGGDYLYHHLPCQPTAIPPEPDLSSLTSKYSRPWVMVSYLVFDGDGY